MTLLKIYPYKRQTYDGAMLIAYGTLERIQDILRMRPGAVAMQLQGTFEADAKYVDSIGKYNGPVPPILQN